MKVLMSAYSCEPNRGSEPGVGWNWALQAARFQKVWVLTRANSRAAIEMELSRAPVPNLHFVYHDLPGCERFWGNSGRGIRPYYLLWQLSVLPLARALHRKEGFDVIHHVTMNPIDVPGFLWLMDAPFIWGPVGGGQEPSPALKPYFEGTWYRELLRIARKRLTPFNPIVRAAAHRAACILVANSDTQRYFERIHARHLIRELETAVQVPAAAEGSLPDDGDTFTVLWAGQLILRKAPLLALDVLAALKRRGVPARLLIAGDGPLRKRIAARAQELGLGEAVALLGALPYSAMPSFYRSGHAFLFSSLHETSGNVLLEAMAHALPVVTLDQHGAADIVTNESGIKVPIAGPEHVVAGLATALKRLAADADLRHRMGDEGRRRVQECYCWDRKGELLQNVYLRDGGAW